MTLRILFSPMRLTALGILLILVGCDSAASPPPATEKATFALAGNNPYDVVGNVSAFTRALDPGVEKIVDGDVVETWKWESYVDAGDGLYIFHYPPFCLDGSNNPITRAVRVRQATVTCPTSLNVTTPQINGRTVSLSVSNQSDFDSVNYTWGDATSSNVGNKDYTSDGTYVITITGRKSGCADVVRQVTVVITTTNACTGNVAPTTSFVYQAAGLVYTFEATSVDDRDTASQLTYSWTFSDGQSAGNDRTPHITFPGNGTYTATLRTEDTCGATSTSTQTFVVYQEPMFGSLPYTLPAPAEGSGPGQFLSEGTDSDFFNMTTFPLGTVVLTSEVGTLSRGACQSPSLAGRQCIIWRGGNVAAGTRVGYYMSATGQYNEIRLVGATAGGRTSTREVAVMKVR